MGFHVWELASYEHVVASVYSGQRGHVVVATTPLRMIFHLQAVSAGSWIGECVECEPPSQHPCPPGCEYGNSAVVLFPHVVAVFLVREFIGIYIELQNRYLLFLPTCNCVMRCVCMAAVLFVKYSSCWSLGPDGCVGHAMGRGYCGCRLV